MTDCSLISIITACYNSSPFIERTYASLKAQVYKNIEWVVVNDGSTDDTLSVLRTFEQEGAIRVVIVDQALNLGHEKAICAGIQRTSGEFTLILDHDDELLPNALQMLMRRWYNFTGSRNNLSGVAGRCIDQNGVFVGTPLKVSPIVTNELELRHVYKIRGELAGMTKTDVLKEAFTGFERGMTHGIMWYRISRKYNGICSNDVIRVYHTNVPTSMSSAKIKYPEGARQACLAYLNENSDYLTKDPFFFFKQTIMYAKHCVYAKKSFIKTWRELRPLLVRIFYFMSLPLLPLLIVRDNIRGRI